MFWIRFEQKEKWTELTLPKSQVFIYQQNWEGSRTNILRQRILNKSRDICSFCFICQKFEIFEIFSGQDETHRKFTDNWFWLQIVLIKSIVNGFISFCISLYTLWNAEMGLFISALFNIYQNLKKKFLDPWLYFSG